MIRLQDKVAVITGAASGIGRETAALFAREGAQVVAVDVNDTEGELTVQAILEEGGRALYVHADVSVASDCESMINEAESAFGNLDIL